MCNKRGGEGEKIWVLKWGGTGGVEDWETECKEEKQGGSDVEGEQIHIAWVGGTTTMTIGLRRLTYNSFYSCSRNLMTKIVLLGDNELYSYRMHIW